MRNGHIKRITDPDIQSFVLEIVGTNVSTTYITCPADPRKTLGIKLPYLVMIVKNMKKYFTFEVQVCLQSVEYDKLFSISIRKFVAFTKFLPIKCEKEFPQFPHCEFSFFHNVIYLQSKMAVMIFNLSDEYIASYTGRR